MRQYRLTSLGIFTEWLKMEFSKGDFSTSSLRNESLIQSFVGAVKPTFLVRQTIEAGNRFSMALRIINFDQDWLSLCSSLMESPVSTSLKSKNGNGPCYKHRYNDVAHPSAVIAVGLEKTEMVFVVHFQCFNGDDDLNDSFSLAFQK